MKTKSIARTLLGLVCSVLFAFAATGAGAQTPAASATPTAVPATATPKVIGLLFYADWCASCKVLEPKLAAIKKDFAGQPVLFTRADQTDDFAKEQSALLAAALGLGEVYAAQGGKTGYMLLLDASSHRVLGKLTKLQEEAELKQAIADALKG